MSEKIVVVNSKFNSIFTFIGVALIIVALIAGYFLWKNLSSENARLRNEIVEFKQLTDNFVRSSNKWVTKKDLKNQMKDILTKEDLKTLKDDMGDLGSRLSAVGRTVGTIKKKIASLEESDREGAENKNIEKCDDGRLVDVHEYTKKSQIKELKDSNTAPLAKVEFNAANKKPWGYEIYKRDYKMVTVVGKKDSGQLTFHHKVEYSVPEKDKEKKYPVELLSSDYMQVSLKNKMYWLNPKLDVNFFFGGKVYGFALGPGRDSIVSMGGDLGLSLSSYGETKADSLFRLFRFGLGYNAERRAAQLSFCPFTFNVGKTLPLLTNLYLGPQIGIDTGGGVVLNVGIGLQL